MNNISGFIEISDNVFIGTKYDYAINKHNKDVWFICATNTRDINVNQETIFRNNTLFLNLIDAKDIKYINEDAINAFISFYNKNKDKPFYIFCDKGQSRSPTLAALTLIIDKDKRISANTFEEFINKFRNICYDYTPNQGMYQYLQKFWNKEKELANE